MIWRMLLLIACLWVNRGLVAQPFPSTMRPRLIVLADMGNEHDEMQQMVHLMIYANRVDLEGLIAVTGKFLNPASANPLKQRLYPELFHQLIDAYGAVRDNLLLHEADWPSPDSLHSLVFEGQRQYGLADVGAGKSSDGAECIKSAILQDDPRPLNIVINAGSNTLAQALFDLRKERTPLEMALLIQKLRVYENGAQDNAGAWMLHEFPAIHWIRSNYQTYAYGGPGVDGTLNNQGQRTQLGPHIWQPYAYNPIGQHQWLLEHIIGNHGQLGGCYPLRQFRRGGISFMEGGGTIPWLGLVNPGLSHPDYPHWGGWSGRYSRSKQLNVWSKHASVRKDESQHTPFYAYQDTVDRWVDTARNQTFHNIFAPVYRWREAMYHDFQCRMDWCTKPYNQCNHAPIAAWQGDLSNEIISISVEAGTYLTLDATASQDPDQDALSIRWWMYPEAGTYPHALSVLNPQVPQTTFYVPPDAQGHEIHLILEVVDHHPIASLHDYRRIVITVP